MAFFTWPPAAASSGSGTDTDWESLQAAEDLSKAFVWLDFGTADARISTITYASAGLGLTVTATFSYTLTGGAYRLDGIVRS